MKVSPTDHSIDQELILTDLVDEVTQRLNQGESVDIEVYAARHPEVAEQLMQVFEALTLIRSPEVLSGDVTDSNSLGQLGEFRIIREIGRGGMGVVYEAEQESLGRRVALKVLPLAATLSPQQLQRFRNEARASAALRHAHIVGIHSVGIERGVHYLAMELVEGQSLAELLEGLRGIEKTNQSTTASPSAGTLPIAALSTLRVTDTPGYFKEVTRIVSDVAEAMHYAHSQGIVHRDVKPANLLIDGQSHVWLTDFGLARLETDAGVTLTGDMLGTLRYMSPEQAAGKPGMVDHRCDIHALGATLYELLALCPAFDGNDRSDLLRRIESETPKSLSRIDSRIPQSLDTIVAKAMEKDREDRYQSAELMAADLRAFFEDRPISARPPTLRQRVSRWSKRHSTAVATTFGVLLLCIIGLLSATTIIGRERSVAVRHAAQSSDNFQLALSALEQTLAESVAGNLVVQYEDPKHKELARRGIEFYKQLAQRNNVDPENWATYRLLVCHQQLEKAFQLKSSSPTEAQAAFLKAVTAAERLHNDSKDDPRYLAKLISCLEEHSAFLYLQGRSDEAEGPSRRASILAQTLLSDHQDFPSANYLVGINHYNTGVRLWKTNRSTETETAYDHALEHLDKALKLEPTEERNIYGLAQAEYNLALVYASRDETEQAEKHWRKSLGFWKGLILMRPLWSEYPSRVGATLSNLAVVARQAEDYKRCRQLAEEALSFQKRALQIDPVYPLATQFMQKHYQELSLALSALGNHKALAAIAEERITYFPEVADEHIDAAITLGDCLEQLHEDKGYTNEDRQQLMDKYAQRALGLLAEAAKWFDENPSVFKVAEAFVTLGDGLLAMDRQTDARQAWESAELLYQRVRDSVAPEDQHQFDKYLKSTRERLMSLAVDLE